MKNKPVINSIAQEPNGTGGRLAIASGESLTTVQKRVYVRPVVQRLGNTAGMTEGKEVPGVESESCGS